MYIDTVTLFNRFSDAGKTFWRATVLRNVDFNSDRAKIRATYGEQSGDTAGKIASRTRFSFCRKIT